LRNEDISRTVEVAEEMMGEYDRTHSPLKTARKNAGLTQRELAEKSGVPLRTIRAYEQAHIAGGRASAQSMYNIATVLGCPLDYLLGMQDFIPR
jgi:transcriptional regulator with XRE-family HTH domain